MQSGIAALDEEQRFSFEAAPVALQAHAARADEFPVRTASEILKELESVIANARPVPLTDQVRVGRDRVNTLLTELRQSLDAGRIA
jgi:hypothetical protein